MITLGTLSDIYNRWGDKENLQPLSCAKEEMSRDDLTEKQRFWLQRFIDLWEETVEKERIEYYKTNKQ